MSFNPHLFKQGDQFFLVRSDAKEATGNIDRYRGLHFMVVWKGDETVCCVTIDRHRRNYNIEIDNHPYRFYEVDKRGDIIGPRQTFITPSNIVKE